MTDDERQSILIKLAAEIVRGEGMPPEWVGDWDIPKTTPRSARREIQRATLDAREQCRAWSRRIMDVVLDINLETTVDSSEG